MRAPARLWVLVLAGVALATLIAHAPVLKSQALCLDDNLFLTNNQLVRTPGWHSAGRFFGEVLTPSTVGGYYIPVAMTSLMLDVAAGGRPDQLAPFHRTALALHIACTLLVVVLLYQLFGSLWPAALGGLLFGLHPLTVEPIAWIGERKTQLAALGALLSIVIYIRYTRRRERPLYVGSLAAFALALLSKPTSLPLPFLLVLLDIWPLARFSRRTLIEKLPFFALGALSLVITLISHARTASLGVFATYTPFQGILLGFYKLAFYLTKIVWPARLSPVYVPPRPLALGTPAVLGSIALIALLAAAAVVCLRRTRAPAVAGLFFLIAIAPTLGAVQYSWIVVSDKYLYPLPLLGLLLLVAHVLTRFWKGPAGHAGIGEDAHARKRPAPRSAPRTALGPVIAIVVGLLGVAALFSARAQYGHWRTTETLYQHMLRLAPNEALLRSNYALELQQQGRVEEARRAFEEALALDPGDARIEANLAGTLVRLGRFEEALPHFTKALEMTTEPDVVHSSLGNALVSLGRLAEARTHFDEALRINPRSADAYTNLGRAQALQGDIDGAVASFTRAVECDPLAYTALGNLGGLLARRGDHAGALRRYEAALRINPRFPEAHANMGVSLAALGRPNEAVAQFREALRLAPGFVQAQLGLGDVYLAQGKLEDAIRAYQMALRINPNDSQTQAKLQAALARRAGTP